MNFAIGLAGMNAASARLEASAASIARAATTPSHVSAAPVGAGAVAPASGRGPVPADQAPADGPAPAKNPADADLPAAMVEQIAASAAFMASLNAVRREDDALRALLRDR